MKMKRKIMMTTALAATLATGALPTTSVFAVEKGAPIQQNEAQMGIQPLAQNNLETAVNLCLKWSRSQKIKVFEHEFNVKEIEVVNLGAGKNMLRDKFLIT